MEKQKRYWIIWLVAAAVIIFLLFSFASRNRTNNTNAPQSGHAQHENTGTESSTANSSSAVNDSNTALNQYLKEQDELMATMMEQMAVTPTGNASLDFLKGMIPHHEAAIEMSKSYLKYGAKNRELKDLAEDIMEDQTEEIEEMYELIREIEASGKTDTAQEEKYLKSYDQMMSGHEHMNHGSAAPQTVDQAFAEGMLMHHQMAVDMAKDILEYTDHRKVRELANEIIEAQEKEIKQMERILKSL